MAPATSTQLATRHPLQRFQSPSREASIALHVISLCSFTASFWYLNAFPTMINDSYGWHWQYLTILGLAGATLTSIFGILADITLSPTLFTVKNGLALCSAPLEVVISVLYWGICMIDRRLLVPPEIELNQLADIGFHLVPSLVLTIDLLLFSPPWTIQALPAMGLSSVLAFAYWAWVEQCYKYNGWYPYPLFAVLSTPQRTLVFAGAAAIMTGSTTALQWLYGRLNGTEVGQKRATPANIKGE